MRLFDNLTRYDQGPSDFSESDFDFLNLSARSEFEQIREMLEDWFSKYPSTEMVELRSRFHSKINVHHSAAFFELFMHELLLSLGCSIEVHPSLPDSIRSPDFLVESSQGCLFLLEATVATYKSEADIAAEARLNQVYDVLNRHVDSQNFFLMVEVEQAPDAQPPARKIAKFLNNKIEKANPDQLAKIYEIRGLYAGPEWKYVFEDWSIIFRPIPKKPEARGKSGIRPLGMFSSGFKMVDHRSPLRISIEDKASAYGNLAHPYVIAVNALEAIDEIDIMEALFGKEQFNVFFSNDYPYEVVESKMTRVPDGVWTSNTGPRNTRVSAVLLILQLQPWSIVDRTVRLYHNPWASIPYSSTLIKLPQAVPDKGRMSYTGGRSLAQIMGLNEPPMAG